jgi:glucose-1-phosphate adenylyltransferase
MRRPKPAVPFGGKYKIIDFALSNLFNSGIRKAYILTQYHAYSLNKHIKESWSKWTGLGEFYDTISPETSSMSEHWFKGTADAIHQNLRFIDPPTPPHRYLGGYHSARWTSQMVSAHRRSDHHRRSRPRRTRNLATVDELPQASRKARVLPFREGDRCSPRETTSFRGR